MQSDFSEVWALPAFRLAPKGSGGRERGRFPSGRG
jgi:hypothetical protein